MSHQLPIVGLTNYRPRLSRPVYGTVKSTDKAGISARRANRIKRHIAMHVPVEPDLQSEIKNYIGDDYMAGRGTRPRKTKNRRRRGIVKYRRSPPTLWPQQKLVRLTSNATGSVAGGAAFGVLTFKANSLNDPWGTSSTQDPLGFNEYAAMYNKCVVVSSKIYLLAHASTATGAILYGVSLMPNSTTLSDINHYREHKITSARMLSPDVDHSGVVSKYKGKRYEKIVKWKDAENFHAVTTPADPTTVRYYHVWVGDVTGANNAGIEFSGTIEYNVLFFDPKVPTRS